MFKFLRRGLLTKRKQAKDCDILCLLQSVFLKQKLDRVIPFPMILPCYGSNSGVGSYTSIISRAANRNPIVNSCNSCLSEISASVFSNCSNRAFCCSAKAALSFVSGRTTVTNDPPLSVPFVILCTVFSRNDRLNAILIRHTGSLHRFFIFQGILYVNKQKQEKYICLKLHIEKSGCHPLS